MPEILFAIIREQVSLNHSDCNDGNAAINPTASEICNTQDDNCNGSIDEGLTFITYYVDLDHDNYGKISDPGNSLCQNPGIGFSTNHTDCNDGNALINPGAIESCNGIDDNCNGSSDEGLNFINYYPDIDNDSYGNVLSAGISLCNNPGIGYSVNNEDCNDANSLINPAVLEICNGVDDNCNDTIDDGFVLTAFYQDNDNDNYGNSLIVLNACAAPTGYVADSTDCNDNSAAINPGAPEILPNGIDDDCDGYIDEISVGIISPQSSLVQLTAFPNPTDGLFTAYLQLNTEMDLDAYLELRNLIGQVIFKRPAQLLKGKLSEEIQLDKIDPAGIYLLNVIIDDHLYSTQIIYQK